MRDGVHYQYERHDGRGPAFARYAEMIPRPAKILHLARWERAGELTPTPP